LLHGVGAGLAKAPFAGTAEVMRRLVQAQQHGRQLEVTGAGAEVFTRQIGKAELLLRREFPGQIQLDGFAQGLGL